MTKNVVNISEKRRKTKPRSLEQAAKAAARRFSDNPDVKEPKGFASGSMKNLSDDEETDGHDEK